MKTMDKKTLLSYFDIGIQLSEQAHAMFEPDKADSEFSIIANAIRDLKIRVGKEELMVLIAGEVKAGKSTFINTLVGKKVCPTAPEVCTNVCTLICYGEEFKIFVYLYDEKGNLISKEISEEEISEYSTENLNPKNAKNVAYLVVQTPSKVLSEGIVLIDSPGLGAIDPKHAQETLKMAQRADVLFFLGNTDKELTSFEIASLKSLIEVSKTESVAHILTCCDRGDKETIAHENEEKLKELIPSLNIPVIQVSSLMFQRYVKTQTEAFLNHSGFKQAMAFIYSVGTSKDAIMTHFGGVQLRRLLELIKAKIESYKNLATDPLSFDGRLSDLDKAKQKLDGLIKNQIEWKNRIASNVIKAKANIATYREKQKKKNLDYTKEILEQEMYRDNQQSLTTAVQANLTSSIDEIQEELVKEITVAFVNAKEGSNLGSIEQTICCMAIDKPEDIDITFKNEKGAAKAMRFGRNIVSGFGMGGLAGMGLSWLGTTTVGMKVGVLLGNIMPGLGNLIGAVSGALLGALAGLIYAIFETKEHKKNRLYNACAESIRQFYSEAVPQIDAAIQSTVIPLQNQFLEMCNQLMSTLKTEVTGLVNRKKTAEDNMNELCQLINTLSSLINKLPKPSKV